VAPVLNWRGGVRVIAGATYDLILFLLLWILVGLPVAVFMPTYQCYTSRAKVSELVLAAASARPAIAERIVKAQSVSGVGAGIHVELNRRAKAEVVTNEGTIIVASDDPPAVVIFRPALVDGAVTWKCSGLPAKVMPVMCR